MLDSAKRKGYKIKIKELFEFYNRRVISGLIQHKEVRERVLIRAIRILNELGEETLPLFEAGVPPEAHKAYDRLKTKLWELVDILEETEGNNYTLISKYKTNNGQT